MISRQKLSNSQPFGGEKCSLDDYHFEDSISFFQFEVITGSTRILRPVYEIMGGLRSPKNQNLLHSLFTTIVTFQPFLNDSDFRLKTQFVAMCHMWSSTNAIQ